MSWGTRGRALVVCAAWLTLAGCSSKDTRAAGLGADDTLGGDGCSDPWVPDVAAPTPYSGTCSAGFGAMYEPLSVPAKAMDAAPPRPIGGAIRAGIYGLDHVDIYTPNPEMWTGDTPGELVRFDGVSKWESQFWNGSSVDTSTSFVQRHCDKLHFQQICPIDTSESGSPSRSYSYLPDVPELRLYDDLSGTTGVFVYRLLVDGAGDAGTD